MKYWSLFLLLLLPQALFAADKAENPQAIAEAFFQLMEQKKVEPAFDHLFANAPLIKEHPESLANLKQQTPALLAMNGAMLGHEFLTEESYGTSLVRLLYVVKSEKHPTIWQFFFYKPKDKWFIADLKFNDNFDLLLSIKTGGE